MGTRMTQSEKIAIAVRAALQAQANGTDPVVAALESVTPVENKIDRAALQVKVNAFLANVKMPATDKVFSHLAKIAELVAIAEKEQNAIAANLVDTLSADEKPLVKIADKMTTGTIENGMRVIYSRLGIVVPVRKEIVHDDNFKRGDGFVMADNFADLLAQEKDVDALKWANALNKPGNIFHNKTLRALDLDLFGNADKGQNYGPGSKCRKWLQVYYKPEQTA